jgi:NAD(P)-dependent dehydrogenase (short-subunit alcohol dehydrogenase family)
MYLNACMCMFTVVLFIYMCSCVFHVRSHFYISNLKGGKHGLRALAQSMARELGPEGIHVAHLIVDGAIDTQWIRDNFSAHFTDRPDDALIDPNAIAEIYWALHNQPRCAWSFEMDVRPFDEKW